MKYIFFNLTSFFVFVFLLILPLIGFSIMDLENTNKSGSVLSFKTMSNPQKFVNFENSNLNMSSRRVTFKVFPNQKTYYHNILTLKNDTKKRINAVLSYVEVANSKKIRNLILNFENGSSSMYLDPDKKIGVNLEIDQSGAEEEAPFNVTLDIFISSI